MVSKGDNEGRDFRRENLELTIPYPEEQSPMRILHRQTGS
jgi:hypothetical protein